MELESGLKKDGQMKRARFTEEQIIAEGGGLLNRASPYLPVSTSARKPFSGRHFSLARTVFISACTSPVAGSWVAIAVATQDAARDVGPHPHHQTRGRLSDASHTSSLER
jgi:hypothetical protein